MAVGQMFTELSHVPEDLCLSDLGTGAGLLVSKHCSSQLKYWIQRLNSCLGLIIVPAHHKDADDYMPVLLMHKTKTQFPLALHMES